MSDPRLRGDPGRQPAFNLPPVVVGMLALLVGIHALREYVLSFATDVAVILTLAFIPAREIGAVYPGGEGARVWTFVTYALLHADWAHLIFNGLWLAAFGSPVAWRFGTARFIGYSAAGAIGGALLHFLLFPSSEVPLVGASAAISAHMAAASRFAFSTGGPFIGFQGAGPSAYRRPVAPLLVTLRDRRVLTFLAVWFLLNLAFGLFGGNGAIASGSIAWDAHIGGFVTGLALFSLFDPVRPR